MPAWETVVIGQAAIVAALIYLVRQGARLATAVRYIADHPAEHERLTKATAENTAAIERLTKVIGPEPSPRHKRVRT